MPKHSPLPQHREDVFYRHTILPVAARIAGSMIEDARASAEPAVFVTGNSYMPPGRSFTEAEEIWNCKMNAYGEAFDLLWEEIRSILYAANVVSEVPEHDNAIYVVDLNRWEYSELAGDQEPTFNLNDEWVAIEEAPGTFPYLAEGIAAAAAYLAETFGVKPATARAAIDKAASQGTYKGRGYVVSISCESSTIHLQAA